jgi:hypothetical protein
MTLLAAAMKLRAEVEVDLATLQGNHASLMLQVSQSAEKLTAKEQELAVRDGECRRLIRELSK